MEHGDWDRCLGKHRAESKGNLTGYQDPKDHELTPFLDTTSRAVPGGFVPGYTPGLQHPSPSVRNYE